MDESTSTAETRVVPSPTARERWLYGRCRRNSMWLDSNTLTTAGKANEGCLCPRSRRTVHPFSPVSSAASMSWLKRGMSSPKVRNLSERLTNILFATRFGGEVAEPLTGRDPFLGGRHYPPANVSSSMSVRLSVTVLFCPPGFITVIAYPRAARRMMSGIPAAIVSFAWKAVAPFPAALRFPTAAPAIVI